MGGEANDDQKDHAGQSLGTCAFAPAPEHGNESNKEDEKCSPAKDLHQHGSESSRAFRDLGKILRPSRFARSDAGHARQSNFPRSDSPALFGWDLFFRDALLISQTLEHRQTRIFREVRIGGRSLTQVKGRAAVRDHLPHEATISTPTKRARRLLFMFIHLHKDSAGLAGSSLIFGTESPSALRHKSNVHLKKNSSSFAPTCLESRQVALL